MTNSKSTKKALLTSIISMLLCCAMLVGTTFAWFTDSVTSGKNKIVAGNLDIELEYKDGNEWKPVTADTNLFEATEGEGSTLWEPGHTEYAQLRIRNAGTLALKYKFALNVFSNEDGTAAEKTYTNINDGKFKLSDYLVFSKTDSVADVEKREDLWISDEAAEKEAMGTKALASYAKTDVKLLPGEENAEEFTLAVYMPTWVGNEANYKTGTEVPTIFLGLTISATQVPEEKDSFGPDYDENAEYLEPPVQTDEWSMVDGVLNNNGQPFTGVNPSELGEPGLYYNEGKLFTGNAGNYTYKDGMLVVAADDEVVKVKDANSSVIGERQFTYDIDQIEPDYITKKVVVFNPNIMAEKATFNLNDKTGSYMVEKITAGKPWLTLTPENWYETLTNEAGRNLLDNGYITATNKITGFSSSNDPDDYQVFIPKITLGGDFGDYMRTIGYGTPKETTVKEYQAGYHNGSLPLTFTDYLKLKCNRKVLVKSDSNGGYYLDPIADFTSVKYGEGNNGYGLEAFLNAGLPLVYAGIDGLTYGSIPTVIKDGKLIFTTTGSNLTSRIDRNNLISENGTVATFKSTSGSKPTFAKFVISEGQNGWNIDCYWYADKVGTASFAVADGEPAQLTMKDGKIVIPPEYSVAGMTLKGEDIQTGGNTIPCVHVEPEVAVALLDRLYGNDNAYVYCYNNKSSQNFGELSNPQACFARSETEDGSVLTGSFVLGAKSYADNTFNGIDVAGPSIEIVLVNPEFLAPSLD